MIFSLAVIRKATVALPVYLHWSCSWVHTILQHLQNLTRKDVVLDSKVWPHLSEDGCSSGNDLKDAKSSVGNCVDLHFRHVDCQMYIYIPIHTCVGYLWTEWECNVQESVIVSMSCTWDWTMVWLISLMVSYPDWDLLSIQSKGPRKLHPLRKIQS